MFREAELYYNEFGNLCAPFYYKTKEGLALRMI
jgi:hypothetical protein